MVLVLALPCAGFATGSTRPWLMTDAVGINDNGWILGSAQRVSDNTYHQVLLLPVPEPGTAGLLAVAVVMVLRRRTGRR